MAVREVTLAGLSREQLLKMYYQMVLLRRFEEKAAQEYTLGKIGGFLHLYIGQEANGVGMFSALSPDDYVLSAYREHGYAILKGIDPHVVMAELFGKATGCSNGKGGSMHMYSEERHLLGGQAIVGAQLVMAAGVGLAIQYRDEDFVARVKEITGGKLCAVVYDSIGKTTFPASLDCLRPLGMFVSFGSASGPIEAFNINILQAKGSLYVTRPTLNTYAAKRDDLLAIADDLFAVVGSGVVKVPVNQKYALRDAAKAHRDLEGRATTGCSILVP